MSKVLMRVTEVWRVDDETEAQEIIQKAKEEKGTLMKKMIEIKQKKKGGVVIESNLKVTTQVDYAPQFEEVNV